MSNQSNNNLNQRREFYIHRIIRDGKTYDNEQPKKQEKKVVQPDNTKKVISYAESFGYRESPSRYNNIRAKRGYEESKEPAPFSRNPVIEEPTSDPYIGYYDEGVQYEEEISNKEGNDDIVDIIDDIYQESFVNDVNYNDYSNQYFQENTYPINREDIKPKKEMPKPIMEEDIATKSTPVRETYSKPIIEEEKLTRPTPVRETYSKPIIEEERPARPTPVKEIYSKPKIEDERKPEVVKQPKVKKVKYVGPSLDLLTRSSNDNQDDELEARRQTEVINKTFKESGIRAEVASYIFGPTVTQFLISIEEGANVKDIRKVESNLLMYLQCESIRIQTPIPGKPFAGIEVPKQKENRRTVFLGDMLASKDFKNLDYQVPVAVGQDNYGNFFYIDLTEMPHGLIAGTTKSGKSVCLNAFLLSLIYRFTPEQLRLVLIDPKRIELGVYEGIPHLAMPVVTDNEDFQSALGWVYDEMERRYKEFELYDERNIVDYNEVRRENKEPIMPYIIVMMDEFGDWFADASSDIEMYMQKLAQKARAAGINILLATQRPSKDVIKGTIKANFDTRIAFRVSSWDDSKIILGASGAERLEGKGDMLIRYAGRAEQRFQGAFVPNGDIKKVTRFLKDNNQCNYLVTKEEIHQSTLSRQTATTQTGRSTGRNDERFEEIAYWVVRNKNASVNQITQIFGMGFNRVNDIILALEEMQVISQGVKGKQREVLIDEYQLTDILEKEE